MWLTFDTKSPPFEARLAVKEVMVVLTDDRDDGYSSYREFWQSRFTLDSHWTAK